MTDKPSLPTLPPPDTVPKARRKSIAGWVWLLILIAVAAGAYYFWPRGSNAAAGEATTKGGGGGKKGRGGNAPVVGAHARKGNIGVYVTGLGTVTPLHTVTIKSRVDGQLIKVNYSEGQLVHEGDPLIEIDPRPYQVALDQATGQKMRDEATLNNAKVDQARYETLLSQNAIPEQQLATQKALVQQLTGTVKADEALIDSAKLNLIYCHITAPLTGRIGLRLVDPGNIVHASDANGLLVITQVQPISVVFPIVEDKLPDVLHRWHAGAQLPVEIQDRAGQHKLADGVLRTVDNQIDPTTGMIRLRAETPNAGEVLFPDQFVNVKLLVQEKTGVTLVPSAAVQRTTSTTYVYLVKPDSTVTVRQVTLGVTEGEEVEILSGLEPGDTVVTAGVDRLVEGSKVNVQVPGEGGRGGRGGRGAKGGNAPGADAGPAPAGNTDAPTTSPADAQSGHRKGRGRGRGDTQGK